MLQQTGRAAWAEIDLKAAAENMKIIRERIAPPTKIIAVIKADAYGHGAVAIGRALATAGADILAVATLAEVTELRTAGITAPLMVLGYVPEECALELIAAGGIFTVYDLKQAEQIERVAASLNRVAVVHLKVDTGMSRLGFVPDEAAAADAAAIAALPHIDVQGVFSHFAASDSVDKSFARCQQSRFERFIRLCADQGVSFSLRHMANSAAVVDLPASYYDAVRPGIMLYGCRPSAGQELFAGMKPVMSVKAKIIRLRTLPASCPVSYGCTWRAERTSVVATLPLGYADGVSRLLSNCGAALVGGCRAPIVGRVCMDQLMVDVTDIPQARVGDEAVLIGRQGKAEITVDQVADLMGTINYEVLCHLGARLPKIYLDEDE